MDQVLDKYNNRSAFAVAEFCERNNISTPTYYKLRAMGQGPREMRMAGSVVRISAEAERDWQRAQENPTGAEAEAIEAQRARLKERSQRANFGGAK